MLPPELLERVLRHLAPYVLVRCRAVCRQWRAVVAAMEERDRRFAYACGADDLLAMARALQARSDPFVDPWDEFYEHGGAHFPCTCGLPVRKAPTLTARTLPPPGLEEDFLPPPRDAQAAAQERAKTFSERHYGLKPPARWEELAREHALVREITARFVRLDMRLMIGGMDYPCLPWLPAWAFVPSVVVRPTTVHGLLQLVEGVFFGSWKGPRPPRGKQQGGHNNLWNLLRSPPHARTFYRAPPPPRKAVSPEWRDCWQTISPALSPAAAAAAASRSYDALFRTAYPIYKKKTKLALQQADPSGWSAWAFLARRMAAEWRFASSVGLGALFRANHLASRDGGVDADGRQLARLSDAELTARLDALVAEVDAFQAFVDSQCSVSVAMPLDPVGWIGGLSHSGHLVGVFCGFSEDFDDF